MKTIVVATDGSPASEEAVRYSLELASLLNASVHVIHVVPETEWGTVRASTVRVLQVPHAPDAFDRRPLEQASDLARPFHVALETELLTGDVVDEIVAYADSVDADLIAMGSRGRGEIAGTVGSVSLGVVHEAMRPVVILRENNKRSAQACR